MQKYCFSYKFQTKNNIRYKSVLLKRHITNINENVYPQQTLCRIQYKYKLSIEREYKKESSEILSIDVCYKKITFATIIQILII